MNIFPTSVQLVVMGPLGRVDLTHVTGFESHQRTQSVRVRRLDGSHLDTELPKGWEGSFEVERGNSVVDDFLAVAERQDRSGGSGDNGTMYQYVAETDGSTSTYQYDGVAFSLSNAGALRDDAAVKQRLEFFAVRRRRI